MTETNGALLVFEQKEGKEYIRIDKISDDTIPEAVNGESGFHIYHVRLLTELLLRQYIKDHPETNISEEDIVAISLASSLHDIGKSKVPKSILDYPGKLSPIEYDIVKRHSVLGEEIIKTIENDLIDEKTRKFAMLITRHHHERYDGSGYPDGLEKDDIPLCAQVVSLADAYDALTGERSYKQAFSQDVALEMISGGMCGVFNPELIKCLFEVVGDKVLLDIRAKLEKERRVVQQQSAFVPKRVLFAGNTGYITNEFIENAFPESKVTVVGNTNVTPGRKVKVFRTNHPPIKEIFATYDFDVIIYFSYELTFTAPHDSDTHKLSEILKHTRDTHKNAKFLYLSSLDAAIESATDLSLICSAKEKLCEHFSKKHGLDIKIVRIPHLYSGVFKGDFLHGVFDKIHKNEKVVIDAKATDNIHFISSFDLAQLLSRFIDGWKTGAGILNVYDEFDITFADFKLGIDRIIPNASVSFKGTVEAPKFTKPNTALANEYGWFAKVSIISELEEQYNLYIQKCTNTTPSFFDKLKEFISKHEVFIKTFELLALFLISEFLISITDSALIFSIVDFRMAYIVIMATIHGLTYGLAASGLASLSWLFAKIQSGTRWITIFYEPTNWLSFVFFFLVGALCGYIRLKSRNTIDDLTQQNTLLEEKLVFTRELYTDTYNEKRNLKKQILGSKDSFGKIFDVTRQLDTVQPRQLYLKIMETFEEILENKSVSVYSVNDTSAFGRLEVASRDISSTVSRSISLRTYSEIIENISEKEVWRNTSLVPGLPMFASGIFRNGKLELLIFIWHTQPEQNSLYYVNLFKILCDLVQMSLLRAHDYNMAILEKQFITGTSILHPEFFEKILSSFKEMEMRKVFTFVQLEIDPQDMTDSQLNEILIKKIRTNDILGKTSDGKVRVLLSQATKDNLDVILPRFSEVSDRLCVIE